MAEQKKKVELYSAEYFGLCGIGGILSCGITHTAVTPLDLVKCNSQVNKKDFPNTLAGFKNIWTGKVKHLGFRSGFAGIWKGWFPTLVGYSAQGLCKFGFYEVFKHTYGGFFSPENKFKYRDLIYVAASSSAEFIADVALCPFETVKVRVQTQPSYARGLFDGMAKIIRTEGASTLFGSLAPLWARQVPYTIIKFVAFERIAEVFYGLVGKPKAQLSQAENMGVIFASGYTAGVLCGAVSHPADTLVSKVNNSKLPGSIGEKSAAIYKEIGFKGLWAGFLPRVVMIGTLTGLQWFIYGAFKASVGLPTPGAAASDKK